MDIISTNLLFLLEESWSLQSYTQMVQTFMQTVNGEKSFKGKSIAEIVILNFSHNDWEWTISAELSMDMEVCSSIGLWVFETLKRITR